MEKACRGSSFQDRCDAAIIAVLKATGVRPAEVTGIRYLPDDPVRSDLNLEAREIRVRGKGGMARDRRPRAASATRGWTAAAPKAS